MNREEFISKTKCLEKDIDMARRRIEQAVRRYMLDAGLPAAMVDRYDYEDADPPDTLYNVRIKALNRRITDVACDMNKSYAVNDYVIKDLYGSVIKCYVCDGDIIIRLLRTYDDIQAGTGSMEDIYLDDVFDIRDKDNVILYTNVALMRDVMTDDDDPRRIEAEKDVSRMYMEIEDRKRRFMEQEHVPFDKLKRLDRGICLKAEYIDFGMIRYHEANASQTYFNADDGCHIMLHMDKAGDEKPFSMPFCTVLSLVRTDTGEELYRRRGISRKTARHKKAESAE